jgi:hypothetical protein
VRKKQILWDLILYKVYEIQPFVWHVQLYDLEAHNCTNLKAHYLCDRNTVEDWISWDLLPCTSAQNTVGMSNALTRHDWVTFGRTNFFWQLAALFLEDGLHSPGWPFWVERVDVMGSWGLSNVECVGFSPTLLRKLVNITFVLWRS